MSVIRTVEKAMMRPKLVTPTIEEIAYDMNGSVIFSRVDFNMAFHQIVLARTVRHRFVQQEVDHGHLMCE